MKRAIPKREVNVLRFFHAVDTAWGSSFAAPLAEALSRESGRKVSAPQVHSWAKLQRPIPLWVSDVIVQVLERRAFDLQRQATELYGETQRIKRDLYPPLLVPSPDVDDDGPAPRI